MDELKKKQALAWNDVHAFESEATEMRERLRRLDSALQAARARAQAFDEAVDEMAKVSP